MCKSMSPSIVVYSSATLSLRTGIRTLFMKLQLVACLYPDHRSVLSASFNFCFRIVHIDIVYRNFVTLDTPYQWQRDSLVICSEIDPPIDLRKTLILEIVRKIMCWRQLCLQGISAFFCIMHKICSFRGQRICVIRPKFPHNKSLHCYDIVRSLFRSSSIVFDRSH